jgi:cysteine desulfurase
VIYLDYAAGAPLDPGVADRVAHVMALGLGNPSSLHARGRRARDLIDEARETLANALGVDFAEVLFTSGGTEADNLAILGCMGAAPAGRDGLVVSAIEHHAVLGAADEAERRGFRVRRVAPGADGRVEPEAVVQALDGRVTLVSVMHANNETGAVMDVPATAAAAHHAGALCHTDAVQSFGCLPFLPARMGCDLASVSSHKIGGPPGVGGLYIRRGVRLHPVLHGGSQERGVRPGTEALHLIVGFGEAVRLAMDRREADAVLAHACAGRFEAAVRGGLPDVQRNGCAGRSRPGIVNLRFGGLDGAAVVISLDMAGVAASTGAACSAGSPEPSHVLLAMGLDEDEARASVRFSFGRGVTEEQADQAASIVVEQVRRMRRGV